MQRAGDRTAQQAGEHHAADHPDGEHRDQQTRRQRAVVEADPRIDEAEQRRAGARGQQHGKIVALPARQREGEFGPRALHDAGQQQDQPCRVAGRHLRDRGHDLGEESSSGLAHHIGGDDRRHAPEAEEDVECDRTDQPLRDQPELHPGEIEDAEDDADGRGDDDLALRPGTRIGRAHLGLSPQPLVGLPADTVIVRTTCAVAGAKSR
jgi:hypothetical protein